MHIEEDYVDMSGWTAVLILVCMPPLPFPPICTSTSFPPCPELKAELQLDWLKGIRGGVRRVQFLDTQQPQRTGHLTLGHNRPRACLRYTIYLKVSRQHTSTNTALASYTRTCCPVYYWNVLSLSGGWWVQGQTDTHLTGPELQLGSTLSWPRPPTCPQPLQQHLPPRACKHTLYIQYEWCWYIQPWRRDSSAAPNFFPFCKMEERQQCRRRGKKGLAAWQN